MAFPICTLLTLLLLSSTVYSATPVVIFTYQSQNISYQTWFDYLTLCFAPLIAHIIAGVSSPIVIPSYSKQPSWSACLPNYNPVSIVWRWYAIGDRRARARNWDAADMAACNAAFWDAREARWDGSEDIMLRSRAWIIKVPEKKYVPLISASCLTTIILALQGVQAGFLIFATLKKNNTNHFAQGLPNVFIALGYAGLVRLPAALWLSGDYAYLDVAQTETDSGQNIADTPAADMKQAGDSLLELNSRRTPTTTAIVSPLATNLSNLSALTNTDKPRLYSTHSRVGLLYRIWWFLSVVGLMGGGAVSTSHLIWSNPPSFRYVSISHLLFNIMYFAISTSIVLIISTYILLGRTSSTLIPCIHATWYKVHTVVLAVLALTTVIVTGLETRQLQNGDLSTLPQFLCNNMRLDCVPVERGHGNFNV
jgi:hypothetical protein